jgi:D-3-phosphoglycerate dehydrogenase
MGEVQTMKILVGFSDVVYPSVSVFRRFGHCTFIRYDKEFLEYGIRNYDILVPHLFERIGAETLSRATNLSIIATPTTGLDHIDVDYLKTTNIKLISLNDDRSFINSISSTAELSFLLLLSCVRNMRRLLDRVYVDRNWTNSDIRGNELRGKCLGVVGYGRLGKMLANYGTSFGMRVIAFDPDSSQYDDAVEPVDFEVLLSLSDFISIHAKLNQTSKRMFNRAAVDKMKTGVIIVNTARGEIIDSCAVLDGLKSGKIAGVGLDVCNGEYESGRLPDDPLLRFSLEDPRVIITPHVGGATHDAHARVFEKVADLIDCHLAEIGKLK